MRRDQEPEQRALAALHALRADRAPGSLKARIEAMRSASVRGRQSAARRAWPSGLAVRRTREPARALLTGFAGALIAGVVVIALLLSSGAPGSPSVSEAAALAAHGPVLGAPAADPDNPIVQLRQHVGSLYFPNWQTLGWRATGRRVDHMGGRTMVTVFYARQGRSVAYTIVGTPALAWPNAHNMMVGGTRLEALGVGPRVAVTWRRSGHTCILSGARMSARTLAHLAAAVQLAAQTY